MAEGVISTAVLLEKKYHMKNGCWIKKNYGRSAVLLCYLKKVTHEKWLLKVVMYLLLCYLKKKYHMKNCC